MEPDFPESGSLHSHTLDMGMSSYLPIRVTHLFSPVIAMTQGTIPLVFLSISLQGALRGTFSVKILWLTPFFPSVR